MYRFESSIDKRELDKRYKKIYVHARLQKKWNDELAECPELSQTLPTGVMPDDMLTMKYEKLVDVYLLYRQVYDNVTDDRKKALNAAAGRVFTYGSYSGQIKRFLMNPNNRFEIYNCVYCDLSDGREFGDGYRQFDTEHILDKGECPLVGLSLYNFCPACGTCNTVLKGSQPIGNGAKQMKKLGPTSKLYDFKHKVRFVINEKPEAVGGIKYDHPEWYEIDFDYKDDDYRIVTSMFDLKNRYNLEHHKLRAIKWLEKSKKYRGIATRFIVLLHIKTEEQVREEIFHLEAHRKAHSDKLKLLEDIIGI